jgi:coenzyme PQQ synthesis protein D (PqqD)
MLFRSNQNQTGQTIPMPNVAVYRHAPDLIMRKVGDEAVVVPVRNRVGDLDSVFTLNDVARRVWELLDGTRPVDAIVDTIVSEYDVPSDVAGADIHELLRTLEDASLVQKVAD